MPVTQKKAKTEPVVLHKGLLGKKLAMSQLFDVNGKQLPITILEVGPCTISQIKTLENDGYTAVQLGFSDLKAKHVNKPAAGHFKKSDSAPKKFLQEFKFCGNYADTVVTIGGTEYKLGGIIKADMFSVGDMVDVTGTSKGKGFQGTIKRHGNHRIKETHGSGPVHRHAGSMGACSSPSRIYKGKTMPGHMGAVKVTVQNLEIVKIDLEHNLIAVKGAVPGPNGGTVRLVNAVKGTKIKGSPAQIINYNPVEEKGVADNA